MAGPLAAMERFFERIFERPAARLLAPRLEAVHLQRHLERAMEGGRIRRAGKWHVQIRYRLLLNPADLIALSGREALPAELGEMLRDHARRRGYVLESRPSVRLEASSRMVAGEVVVMTDDLLAAGQPGPAGHQPASQQAQASRPDDTRARQSQPVGGSTSAQPSAAPVPPDGAATSLHHVARPAAPRATVVIRSPGQQVARIPVDGATLRIGRGADNDIVLADGRVSRRHGQISVRLGTLIYTDLNSTNGSYLQGSRIQEIALGPHDVIQLGGSTLTIEPAQ